MSTTLGNAVAGMARTLERLAGFEGEFRRAGGNTTTSATLTERQYEVLDEEGLVMRVESFDWLFRVSELAVPLPQPGDQWFVADFNAAGVTADALFEAMPIGSRPCCESHDSQGEMLVVHTKKVRLDA